MSPRELVNAARELTRWRLATLKKRLKKARVVDFPWAREWYQAALAVGAIPR